MLLKIAVATAVTLSAPAQSTPVDVGANKSYAQVYMLEAYGWDESEFACLETLWQRESGWNHTSRNRRSEAYGIPQALPGSKMRSAGADWKTNPETQIKWGLGYIESRYGTPCGAYQHFQKKHWY